MKTIYRQTLPSCDICKADNLDVVYDMPYQGSTWANVCKACCPNPNHPIGTKIVKGDHPKAKGYSAKEEQEYLKTLTFDQIEEMMFDGVVECADGCEVEPDGKCPHGYSSPLLLLGYI